jgi:hypothetical protein
VQAACGAGTRVFQNFQAFLANPQREMVLSSYEFDTGSSASLTRAPYLGRGFMSILRAVPSRVAHSVSVPVLRHGVDIGRAHRQQLARIDHPAARAQGDTLGRRNELEGGVHLTCPPPTVPV